jgi:hypothetical protein
VLRHLCGQQARKHASSYRQAMHKCHARLEYDCSSLDVSDPQPLEITFNKS